MNVENALYPTADRVADLTAATSDQPIVMLNLLKFRERAQYADGRASELSGRDAYMLYGAKMQQVVEREGGRMVFSGEIMSLVIGTVEEMWDVAALVEYPSSAAFARIVTSPEVGAIGVHRAAGLAGQLLIRVAPTNVPQS
jgi:uncharacterized protein (DUF1330 family)